MKVVAINGSSRANGNTAILIREVLKELEEAGIDCEMIQLAGMSINGCRACYKCRQRLDSRCAWDDDDLNSCLEKIIAAEGLILASPTYFADITPQIKALIDRVGVVVRANGHLLARRVGAALVTARRGGSIHTFDSLNHFFLINQMIVPGSSYWNLGFGKEKGEVTSDEEGLATMRTLGRNFVWLLNKLR